MDEKRLPAISIAIATTVIVSWLGVLVLMLSHVGDEGETAWDRLAVVLNSIEAIAFAAAGAMFSATVQGHRVREAKERADRHEDAAMKGKSLAHAIRARAKSGHATAGGLHQHNMPPGDVPPDIAAMADALFPSAGHETATPGRRHAEGAGNG